MYKYQEETLIRRNPYFIGINSAIGDENMNYSTIYFVAILILLELTLQLKKQFKHLSFKSRNPYFIGINSAIYEVI